MTSTTDRIQVACMVAESFTHHYATAAIEVLGFIQI